MCPSGRAAGIVLSQVIDLVWGGAPPEFGRLAYADGHSNV